MEPEVDKLKPVAMVIWIALITAIVVTIIDWKIKQDILRLTDAFYRIYPSTMEATHDESKTRGHNNSRPVLRIPVVDSDAGVEEEKSPTPRSKNPEDHSENWAQFAPDIAARIATGPASDS